MAILATAIALSNKLYFFSDPEMHTFQNVHETIAG